MDAKKAHDEVINALKLAGEALKREAHARHRAAPRGGISLRAFCACGWSEMSGQDETCEAVRTIERLRAAYEEDRKVAQ